MFNFSKKVNSIIVVDIGSKLTLLYVELRGRIKVRALKVVDFVDGLKDETVVSALKDFIKENKITYRDAILKPDLNSLLIKRIQLPAMPDSELEEAIKWQLKEEVPYDLNEADLDFTITKRISKEDGSNALDVMCVLAKRDEISHQVMLLKQAGVSCLCVNFLPFGYANLIEHNYIDGKEGAVGILHLVDDSCFLSIFENSKLVFYRELPISKNKLMDALKVPLVSEKGKVELSDDEISEVLSKIGVPLQESFYKESLSSSQIFSMIRPHLEHLAEEMKRSLTYFESHLAGAKLSKILLAGVAANISNLDTFLKKELSFEVESFSTMHNISASSNVYDYDLLNNYATVGLSLSIDKDISLLPHEFRTEGIEKVEKISIRWIAFIAFLVLAVLYFFMRVGITNYQRRLDNATLHLNILSEVQNTKTKINELSKFIGGINSAYPRLGAMLKKLSNVATKNLFMKKLTINCSSNSGIITGYIKNIRKDPNVILTEFIEEMEDSGYFIDASISSIERKEEEGISSSDFVITFKLLQSLIIKK